MSLSMSLSLEAGHWSKQPAGPLPEPLKDLSEAEKEKLRPMVAQAVRHALKASTGSGQYVLDPDALVQNTVVALVGPYPLRNAPDATT